MEFRILGPLEVRTGDRPVALGGAKPRAVLAMLALHANQPVSAERLAAAVWGEDVPPSAVKTVQVYVARLRKALGDPDVLVATPAGYRLRVGEGELDAQRFEREVAGAREALAAGRGEQAAATLRDALSLWRGPPLAELGDSAFAPAEIARLEEQRLTALELRLDADLAAGRHAELVGELRQLTELHPLRERLHAQLMTALYRGGRQAEALEAYRAARAVLVEELGIEPGAELQEVHRAVLAQDPEIAAPRRDRRLPAPPNRTVGREGDLAELAERLRAARLLTLTGPGGVGKTRLALEAARAAEGEFADGARFVSLVATQRPEDVPAAVVAALAISPLPGESAAGAAERFLAGRRLLLVADNFEHVLAAAPFVGGLLDACPGVTVLATSRERLALQAEERYPVAPLGDDGVTLFAERARAVDPAFELGDGEAVADICRRVDGLPLAIELAAARCGLLSPAEIAARLDTALGEGARDLPTRQRTLSSTIAWSHDLLTDEERQAFARFAVFAGSPDIEAAEAVTEADLDTLDRLVAKSLLVRRRSPGSPTRLAMLETIRAFARERLEASGAAEAVRERHFRHCLALAEQHGTERALWGADHQRHVTQLDASLDDLHSALDWAVGRGAAGPAAALCAALRWYWWIRDRSDDALEWVERVLRLPGVEAHADPYVRMLCTKGWVMWVLGRREAQTAVMDEAESAARALGAPVLLARVLEARANQDAAFTETDDPRLDEALALARAAGDEWATAMVLRAGVLAAKSLDELRTRVGPAAALLEQVGNLNHLASVLASAAYTALGHGADDDASAYVARAMTVAERLDIPHLWMLVHGNDAVAALFTGEFDAARRGFREELRLCRELDFLPFVNEGLRGLAALAVTDGDAGRAARLRAAAEAHRYGQPVDPVDRRMEERFFAALPDSEEGRALNLEDAIAYALSG
jgi:predicted ATPase/DNA-binding SARP family transcriptional activator